MNCRKLITMTDEEIQAFLQDQRILQVATIGHDGYPHLVPMWYVLLNRQIVFWTYVRSQKAFNLRRDPRLTCLVESGQRYEELQGVQIKGQATIYDDRETVQHYGELIFERYMRSNENISQMVIAQASKRLVVAVNPIEIVSWDHRKLGGVY